MHNQLLQRSTPASRHVWRWGLAFGLLLDLIWLLDLLFVVNVLKVETLVTMPCEFPYGRAPYIDDSYAAPLLAVVIFELLCILVAGLFAAFLSRSVLASVIAGAFFGVTTAPAELLPLFRAIFSADSYLPTVDTVYVRYALVDTATNGRVFSVVSVVLATGGGLIGRALARRSYSARHRSVPDTPA